MFCVTLTIKSRKKVKKGYLRWFTVECSLVLFVSAVAAQMHSTFDRSSVLNTLVPVTTCRPKQ